MAAAQKAEKDVRSNCGQTRGVENLLLAGVEIPEPVFFCTIEPPSMARQPGIMPWLKQLILSSAHSPEEVQVFSGVSQ